MRIGYRTERRAFRQRAMIARDQRLGHQPITVAFNRVAQRLQFGRDVAVRGGNITRRGQFRDQGGRI